METPRNRLDNKGLLITALAVSVLVGCGTSKTQAPAASASVAGAPQATLSGSQPPVSPKSSKRAVSKPEAPTEQNTATVLSQMHEANLIEISTSKIAEQKASKSEVRAYAEQLVQDQTSVDQMVLAMAQKKGARLKRTASALPQGRHQTARERKLKSASGIDFDRLFLKQTSADHQRLIRKLQQDREDASDDELEALIDKVIPILEQHQQLAQILIKKERA